MNAGPPLPETAQTDQAAPLTELPTVRGIAELRAAVADWRHRGHSVGLVPTMGALHEGHLALIRQSRADCGRTVASLFVNPTQFNDPKDLRAYPRDAAGDAALFAAAGTDLLYAPAAAEVYPEGFATQVRVAGLGDCLCGATRPGHMEGVATVVAKLLNQVRPDIAYFGEKDFQQLQIIRRMAADLDLEVTIAGVPTVREPDGLALSSRNLLLTPDQRRAAPALHGRSWRRWRSWPAVPRPRARRSKPRGRRSSPPASRRSTIWSCGPKPTLRHWSAPTGRRGSSPPPGSARSG